MSYLLDLAGVRVVKEDGTELTASAILDFQAGITASYNAATNTIEVSVAGAGAGDTADKKESVRAATTANHALSGLAALDGVAIADGDRILVKDQTIGSQNGIYIASAGAWTRATDFDADSEVTSMAIVPVEEGTVNGTDIFFLTTPDPITVGTTALTFSRAVLKGDVTGDLDATTVAKVQGVDYQASSLGVGNISDNDVPVYSSGAGAVIARQFTLAAVLAAAAGSNVTGGTDIGVTSGDNVNLLGATTTATSGRINAPHATSILAGRNSGDTSNASLASWGVEDTDFLTIGDDTIVSELSLRATSAVGVYVGAAPIAEFSSALVDFQAIDVTTTGDYTGANLFLSADIQFTAADITPKIWQADETSTANADSLAILAQSNTNVTSGDGGALLLGGGLSTAGTPGPVQIQVQGTDVAVFNATTGNFQGLDLTTTGRYLAGSGSAVSPSWSFSSGGSDGWYRIGSGDLGLTLAGTLEYEYTATQFDAKGNHILTSASVSAGGGTVDSRTAVSFRVAHDTTNAVLGGRNGGDTDNADLLSWGKGTTNRLTLGEDTNVASIHYRVATSGAFGWFINNATRFVVDDTSIEMGVADLRFASTVTNPVIRQETGSTGTGDLLLVHAQDITTGTGGDLGIRPGSGSTAGGEGYAATGGGTKRIRWDDTGLAFFNVAPVARAAAYTRNATVVEDRTLLASASATTTNNNNVLAALIADLQAYGLLQ